MERLVVALRRNRENGDVLFCRVYTCVPLLAVRVYVTRLLFFYIARQPQMCVIFFMRVFIPCRYLLASVPEYPHPPSHPIALAHSASLPWESRRALGKIS